MNGPGEYVPDITEGITRVEDLPKARIERRSRTWPARRCPRCRHRAGRYATGSRMLHDLGDARADCPVDLVVTFSRHRFRKAQNSIYSVRTKEHLEQRLALDMHREQRAPKRRRTMKTLHVPRSKHDSLH